MGFSLAWLAVKGKSPADLQQALGLIQTGKHGLYGEHYMVGVMLPSGWYVLIANSCDHAMVLSPAISKGCEMVAATLEEHVMYSGVYGWRDGQEIWSLVHDAQQGMLHLETKGNLPPEYAAIFARLSAEQTKEGGADADVDFYFDIPLETAQAIVGFKHDTATNGVDDAAYEILNDPRAPSQTTKPWWRFW